MQVRACQSPFASTPKADDALCDEAQEQYEDDEIKVEEPDDGFGVVIDKGQ